MSHFGLKINKTEAPDKTPYTVYYPHSIPVENRNWNQGWYQVASIDPARKNYALRIERRCNDGNIIPIVFDKVSIESLEIKDGVSINNTYEVLTSFLDKYAQYYRECHFIIIERQLPQNYKATRIAQHSISYFCIRLHDTSFLPSIIEVDPKLKGKMLKAPKNITDKQLKSWAIEKATELLTMRQDTFSLHILNIFKKKADDLSDTVCQIEALWVLWNMLPTRDMRPAVIDNLLVPLQKHETNQSNQSYQMLTLLQTVPVKTPVLQNLTIKPLTVNNPIFPQTMVLNIIKK